MSAPEIHTPMTVNARITSDTGTALVMLRHPFAAAHQLSTPASILKIYVRQRKGDISGSDQVFKKYQMNYFACHYTLEH